LDFEFVSDFELRISDFLKFFQNLQIFPLDFSTLIFGPILRGGQFWYKKRAFIEIYVKKVKKTEKK